MPLQDYELLLPYSEWKNKDWPAAIREADGVTKRVLQAQERAAHAIAGINPTPTTPEKLAWVVLWGRAFVLLQAAIDLQGQWSVPVSDYLYRIAFELWLQVAAIRDPWDRLSAARKDPRRAISISDEALDRRWVDVAGRLRGFCAWALTNDLVNYRQRNRRWELDKIYAPTDPATLVREPLEEDLHTHLFGEDVVLSANEARSDKARAKERHEQRIQRLLDWLKDPVFDEWAAPLAPWITGEQVHELPTLFALFDPEHPTVADVLANLDAGFLYASYARGSMLLHGSSIEHFTATSARRIFPTLFTTDEEGARLCGEVANMCNLAVMGLWGLRDHCISQ